MEEASAPKGVASRYERGSEEFSRTLALSDGVFAIAMTLLVVGIALPTLDHAGSTGEMLDALDDLSASFISFFVSFAVIGRYWAAHQEQFSMLARMDRGFVALNLVYLTFIALLPFPTDLLGNYFENLISIGVYAANVAIISGMEVILAPQGVPRRPARAPDARGRLPLGRHRRFVAFAALHSLDPDRVPEHDGRRGRVVPSGAARRRHEPLRARRGEGVLRPLGAARASTTCRGEAAEEDQPDQGNDDPEPQAQKIATMIPATMIPPSEMPAMLSSS